MQTKEERIENTERFYEWLCKMKNIHLADNDKIQKAFEKVYNA